MKTIKLIIVIVILNSITAYAQEINNKHQFFIDIGLTGGKYKNSNMLGSYGSIGVFFKSFGKQSAIEVKSKEHYVLSPEMQVGALSLTYRVYLARGFYLGVGGAHNHGIAFKHFEKDPLGSIFATNVNVFHRTGLIAETGYDFRSFIRKGGFGIYPVSNLAFTYMPGYGDPIPMVNLSIGFRFGFKRLADI